MYKTGEQAKETVKELLDLCTPLPQDREVLILPPFTALQSSYEVLSGNENFFLGAQNLYPEKEGAFTGEISPQMLVAAGCTHALAGHSERRHILGDSDQFVGEKMAAGMNAGLCMILCIGETIEERKAGDVEKVLARQIGTGMAPVAAQVSEKNFVLAYEPVWAIGTGEVAKQKEILHVHNFCRKFLQEKFPDIAPYIRILYGGSVKPDNVREILSLDNVDGVLVGGASLSAQKFSQIVSA